jgi:hypothetical protein
VCIIPEDKEFLVNNCAEFKNMVVQGRIKGFVGPTHFSSLGPLGESKSIVGTTVYCRLSGLMEGEVMYGYLRNTDNPNFIALQKSIHYS